MADIFMEYSKDDIDQKFSSLATPETINNINTQLADIALQKVGGGVLATMNDMGQDVKTSMTGGSVAVVGPNAVQTINILDNAVTATKTDFITKSPQIYDWKNDTGLVKDYRVQNTDGTIFSATGYSATGYIPVSPSRNLVYGDQKGTGGVTLISLNNSAVYDANKVFIVGYGGGDSGVIHTLPSNAAYIRKSFNGDTSNAQNLGVFYDQVSTDFIFWRKLDNTKVEIPNADYATNAGSATSATNATNATNWTNLPSLYNYSFNRYNYKTVNLEQSLNTTTGQISSHSGLAVSDYCELTSTNKVYLGYQGTSAYQSSFSNVVLYDQNKTMIQDANTLSDYTVDTSVTPNMINFTPPSNAKYIRFQMQQGYGVYDFYKQVYLSQGSKPTLFNFNNFYYEVIKDSSSKWVGKKIVAYGDSTSAGTSYSTLTWLGKVCAKLQTIPVNRAIGGSTVNDDPTRIAWVSDGTTDPTHLGPYGEYVSRPSSLDDGSGTGALSSTQPSGTVQIDSSMCTDDRVNTIPTDADVIVILAGTNGMDQTSYDTMLQKIFTRCPNAIIMCCSLTFRYNDSTYSTITDVSGSNSIIQNLCEIYGCHYIDLKGIECINQFNHGTYMIDNVHANDAGNERRARVIAKAIQLIEPLS